VQVFSLLTHRKLKHPSTSSHQLYLCKTVYYYKWINKRQKKISVIYLLFLLIFEESCLRLNFLWIGEKKTRKDIITTKLLTCYQIAVPWILNKLGISIQCFFNASTDSTAFKTGNLTTKKYWERIINKVQVKKVGI